MVIDISANAATGAVRYGTSSFAYYVEAFVTYATFMDLPGEF